MRFLTNGLRGKEPMLIQPDKAAAAKALADKYAFTDVIAKLFGERPRPYVTEAGDGIVPVVGVLGKGLSPLDRMLGAADIDEISATLSQMEADPAVKRIVLDINSPGGTVTGIEELADKVRSSSKPTLAYTETEMASAAYWVGAAADRVLATASSSIGSIGVYMVVSDYTKAMADAGVAVTVIKSSASPLKAAGAEGTALTAEQHADLQAQVDEIQDTFAGDIRKTRSQISPAAFSGGVFSGRKAASLGLVTGLVKSLDEALTS